MVGASPLTGAEATPQAGALRRSRRGAVAVHLDEALERVLRLRDQLLTHPDAPDRAARLAVAFEAEARAWSHIFEAARSRVVCRAALGAAEFARANARAWARRAAAETGAADPGESVAGRVGAAGPRAAAVSSTGGA